ncbi:MAG: hypothetical protein O3A01_03870 [bacterium]|nr:hypothetical protein [bacterium]
MISYKDLDEDVLNHVNRVVRDFRPLAFPRDFGFDGFDSQDVIRYFTDASQFGLSLRRDTGKGILYGCGHASLRRQFLNGLSAHWRCRIVLPKLQALDWCSVFARVDFSGDISELVDVRDIGMGNSVYWLKVIFKNGKMGEFVLKEKSIRSQVFYVDVLKVLGWRYFETAVVSLKSGDWELSQYVLGQNLNAYISSHVTIANWIVPLAQRAALGDMIGMGDRHVENYVCPGDDLVAVDVSYMFWPDNEDWTLRYISGGVYELNALSRFQLDAHLLETYLGEFWRSYELTLGRIYEHKDAILRMIAKHFPDAAMPSSFFEARINDPSAYLNQMKPRVMTAFWEALRRHRYKLALVQLVNDDPEMLVDHPWLKMYYLADRDRPSAFLHAESRMPELFPLIQERARTKSGFELGFFELAPQLEQLKRTLL